MRNGSAPGRRRVARAVAVAVPLAAGAAMVAAHRRWQSAVDPTGGEPLCLPDGSDRTVTTPDGTRLAVRVGGPAGAPPVVLVHGWTNDRRVWGPVAKRLVERGLRVVLYDQRGHGASGVGTAGLTVEALGDDLAAVLRQLDLRDAVVAGHSMGGMAAQAFACEYPDEVRARVAHLVLVASACDRVRTPRLHDGVVDRAVADAVVGMSLLGRLAVRHSLGRTAVLSQLDAVRDMFVATPREIRAGLRTAMQAMDLADRLGAIPAPVTVVAAAHDRLLPASRSRRIAELVPGADLHVLDAGHMLPWEAADDLTDLLTDRSVAGSAGEGRTVAPWRRERHQPEEISS